MPYGTLAVDTIVPTANLAISGNVTSTGTLTAPNFNSSNAYGMRNRIINGAMGIDQRNAGASQTITAAAALAYTVDRWYAYCTGANVTGQRVAGTGNNQFAYRFTGAASVTAIGFGQRIEAINCWDLAGSTATLSVELANSLLTTVTWTAYYANTADTFGTLASPTRTQIATGTFTVTSTLTRYSTNISIPAAATTGIEIVFTVGAQTSGTWTIDNVQLEAGSVATPFERRLITQELTLCYRYFYQIVASNVAGGNMSMWGGYFRGTTSFEGFQRNWPVTMRVTPSSTVINGAVGNYNVFNGTTAGACSSVGVSGDAHGGILSVTTVQTYSVGSAGQFYAAQGNNIQLNAEL